MPSIKQDDFKSKLDARFPGFQQKEHLDESGVSTYILNKEHVTENYPCYNYGYYIGDDVSHTFHAMLLVVPDDNVDVPESGYAIIRIDGHSLISERNDSNSVSVSCEFDTGTRFDIEEHSFYEKYGGQGTDKQNPIGTVLQYFQEKMGYTALSEETLAAWFSTIRSRFAF